MLALFGLLAAAVAAPAQVGLPRVYLGDARHAVGYGEVWLVVNGWGHYPGILVGVIRDGSVEPELDSEYPECSNWGQSCTLAVGVAEKALAVAPKTVDTAYGTGPTELSRRFPILYLSARIEEAERPGDWAPVLISMGRAEAGGVVLPRPEKRTLRLLYPDGRPLSGARAQVALFGANNNQCGVAVGIPLGEAASDVQGRIVVTAPRAPLALHVSYYEEQPDGPAGTAYAGRTNIITGPEAEITLKRVWTLNQREYQLTVKRAGGEPVAGLSPSGCLWDPGCGVDCGPLGGAGTVTDKAGMVRFRELDLRRLRNLWVSAAGGRPMFLSADELRELLSTGAASVTWREAPRPPQAGPREP
jgi:hypothetical protein